MSVERAAFSGAIGLAIGLAAAVAFRWQPEVSLAQTFRMPRIAHAPAIDGKVDDGTWERYVVRRIFFGDDRKPYFPGTEARFAHDGTKLYGVVFASDEDVKTRGAALDGVHFTMTSGPTERDFSVTLDGKITATDPFFVKGMKIGVAEGTTGGAHTEQRWAIEFSIPLSLLGIDRPSGAKLAVVGERCEVAKSGARTCGHFGEREAPITFTLE